MDVDLNDFKGLDFMVIDHAEGCARCYPHRPIVRLFNVLRNSFALPICQPCYQSLQVWLMANKETPEPEFAFKLLE